MKFRRCMQSEQPLMIKMDALLNTHTHVRRQTARTVFKVSKKHKYMLKAFQYQKINGKTHIHRAQTKNNWTNHPVFKN